MDEQRSDSQVKITFGIIVLNGEPFTRYNLRALYPFAHEIIVVEGSSLNAAISARSDGHSVDGTLEILRQFKIDEDLDQKITIVTAEDEGYSDGFWPGEKDEQSQAYAKRATGNWLWQVDIDEFYREDDMERVIDLLTTTPSITAVTFPEIPFWGSFDVRCDGILLRLEYSKVHRLFKWEYGYTMITHRPPTVINTEGENLRDIHWIDDKAMERLEVYLYHYTQLFPQQVSRKMAYYEEWLKAVNGNRNWIKNADKWFQKSFASLNDPYHVHTVNSWASWLEHFSGKHPHQIEELISAIRNVEIIIHMRDMTDVEKLLTSRRYQAGIIFWKLWGDYIIRSRRITRRWMLGDLKFKEFLVQLRDVWLGKNRLFRFYFTDNRR